MVEILLMAYFFLLLYFAVIFVILISIENVILTGNLPKIRILNSRIPPFSKIDAKKFVSDSIARSIIDRSLYGFNSNSNENCFV
mgnify:CR=1 FL=1